MEGWEGAIRKIGWWLEWKFLGALKGGVCAVNF
jgi:hypothetical protein